MRQVQRPRLRQAHPAVAAGDGRQALQVFIVDGLILLNSSSHVRDDSLRGDPPAHHRAVERRG